MSVQITKTSKNYTWDDCNFPWADFTDTWDEAAFTAFDLIADENIYLDDKLHKIYETYFKEDITLVDAFNNVITLFCKENIALNDTILRKVIFNLVLYDFINIASKCINEYQINKDEAFGIKDFCTKAAEMVHIQQLNISEELQRKFEVDRDFFETIGIKSGYHTEYNLIEKETLGLYDTILQACQAVLSNISIGDGEMSLYDFKKALKTAPGFTEFIDFKVGEYEYQEALVRLVIDAAVAQTQPSAAGVIMHVDIPDTDDRGIAEITDVATPTKVYFNKHYYQPPEVSVTLRGGNTGDGYIVPHLITTEGQDEKGRYFEVELLNSMQQRVTGLISWISKGY